MKYVICFLHFRVHLYADPTDLRLKSTGHELRSASLGPLFQTVQENICPYERCQETWQ
jgi:hypothetical protein